ncbi:MAG: DUF1592 domain-containing protein [Verrucomicrobiales bacterium]
MPKRTLPLLKAAFTFLLAPGLAFSLDTTPEAMNRFVEQYCIQCHGGETVKGKVDFTTISMAAASEDDYDFWQLAAEVVEYEDMPPEDEKQPSPEERAAFQAWYETHYVEVEAAPGVFKPRRLSTPEYRHTMRSLFGFDLENNVQKAEQTAVEPSLILKLMPTDPPGESGFINDTHAAPISTVIWDQYAYFSEVALIRLFSRGRPQSLNTLLDGDLPKNYKHEDITPEMGESILRNFATKAYRRPVSEEEFENMATRLDGLSGAKLVKALKFEMQTILMSPGFLYRGMRMEKQPGKRQQEVDTYELAERLSYFLWEDSPDEELFSLAANGTLSDPKIIEKQVDRMLKSPRARTLADSFATQWLALDEIDDVYNDPYQLISFKSQPLDFLNYLFTEERPVMEMIDSDVTFTSHVTAGAYPKDRKKLEKHVKPKGIEKQVAPNQKLILENTEGRGGLLTMPAILAMNHGPIIRGTWTLRRILGEHLGEPPADIPPIQTVGGGKKLSFREQFEMHRDNATCARCHDKIDPLGFAFEAYNEKGAYLLSDNSSLPKEMQSKKQGNAEIDTAGKLPTGETFEDFEALKQIFMTSRREDIVRNTVKQTLSYALCRKLEAYDGPTVDAITAKLVETDGTWQDLFTEIAKSLPFRQTIITATKES